MSISIKNKVALQKIANDLDKLGLTELADELDLVIAGVHGEDAAHSDSVVDSFNVGDVLVTISSEYSLDNEEIFSWEAKIGNDVEAGTGYSDLDECGRDAVAVAKYMQSQDVSLDSKDYFV